MPSFPPRIHVLLASDADVGLVIRRGPSKCVATIGWNRTTDEFQLGQWLKGKIFERRCDLSADGKYLLYFAMNGKWHSESRGSWSAISRAPYLKAIAMFPKGDCWQGGGLWIAPRTYWLNGQGYTTLHDSPEVLRDANYFPAGRYGAECLGVYYPRLLRDGWTQTEEIRLRDGGDQIHRFEKKLPHGWMLRKLAHAQHHRAPGRGCYWDEHEVVNAATNAVLPCPRWEWAERDKERVVWAADGRLFAATVTQAGLGIQRELADFRDLTFTPIKAPY
ncbi:MAG: hypothetical protein JSS27_09885 [Planctomycetes bacterium]|nr:hypothetical protein [Planctomycetota bacterium]